MWGRTRALEQEVKQLRDQLAELTEDVRELRDLPVEWQDWLHKIRNVLARLNRRAERDEEAAPAPARPLNPAALRLLGRAE